MYIVIYNFPRPKQVKICRKQREESIKMQFIHPDNDSKLKMIGAKH